MTGQSTGGPVRILLRAPPHLPFIQGWPGIPPAERRASATVQGTVEVRIGQQPVKAKWVRVEVRKHESVPSAVPGKPAQSNWSYVGGKVHTLWKAPDGKEFDTLQTADFRFVIPLPADVPPSVELPKGIKVHYELVASVCYKGKGGIFKKDPSTITAASEHLRVVKHELASAWPVFNHVESRVVRTPDGAVSLSVDRTGSAYGPGDRIIALATVESMSPQPLRLNRFDVVLVEIVTIMPSTNDHKKKAKASAPTVKRSVVASSRNAASDVITRGDGKRYSLDLVVPTDRPLMTVRHAQAVKVEYELVFELIFDEGPPKLALGGFTCVIGTFSKSSAQQAVRDIGYVEGLCPPPRHGQQPQLLGVPGQPGTPPPGHQQHPSLSGQGGIFPPRQTPSPLQSNAGPIGNSVTHSMYQRPLSMEPPHDLNDFGQIDLAPLPPSSPPRVTGFTPRDSMRDRRSSSGTTATTTTMTTEYGQPDRNVATMPNPNVRASIGFPSPHLNGGRSPPPGRPGSVDDSVVESLRERAAPTRSTQSDAGHRTLSMQTTTTFGGWNPTLDGTVDEEEPASPSATTSSGAVQTSPSRGSTPTPVLHSPASSYQSPASGFPTVPSSSLRVAAIQNSAVEAAAPSDEPPGYAPPARASPTASMTSSIGPLSHGASSPVPLSAVGHGPSFTRGPSATPPPMPHVTPKQHYPTAAQEKDMARMRYEQATHRVVSNGSASGSPSAGSTTSPVMLAHTAEIAAAASAAAIAATASGSVLGHGQGHGSVSSRMTVTPAASAPADKPIPYDDLFGASSSSSAGPSHPPVPGSSSGPAKPPYMSAAAEKDMMRKRYEQAQGAVGRTGGDDSPMNNAPSPITVMSAAVQPPPGGMISTPPAVRAQSPPAGYMTAAQEKDMMRRRYENAQHAVGRTTSPTNSNTSPVASGSSTVPQAAAVPSSSSVAAATAAPPAGLMTAAQEKDMMRRRYEDATRRVASPTGEGSGLSSTPPAAAAAVFASPTPQTISPSTSSKQSPAAYKSAAEEKEEMRRRYEQATMGVARATGDAPAGSSSMAATVAASSAPISAAPAPNPSDDPIPYDELFGAGGPSSSSGPSGAPPAAPYMSAAEEKDMMRRRFEDAQNRVARQGQGSSSGAGGGAATGSMTPSSTAASLSTPSSPPGASMSSSSRPPGYGGVLGHGHPGSPTSSSGHAQRGSPARVGSPWTHERQVSSGPVSPGLIGSGAGAGSGSGWPGSSDGGYMSAEKEKDLMRRRYEEATGMVASPQSVDGHGYAASASGHGAGSGSVGGSGSGSPSGTWTAGSAAPKLAHDQHHPARSATMATGASGGSGTSVGGGSLSSRAPPTRAATVLPDGPPPPLAPRPPREYIERI